MVVERLTLPAPSLRIRAAQLLDVMEIQYVAQLQSDDDPARIVDSSAQRSAPGTTTSMHLRQPLPPNIANHSSFTDQDLLPRVSTTYWGSRMDLLGSSLQVSPATNCHTSAYRPSTHSLLWHSILDNRLGLDFDGYGGRGEEADYVAVHAGLRPERRQGVGHPTVRRAGLHRQAAFADLRIDQHCSASFIINQAIVRWYSFVQQRFC